MILIHWMANISLTHKTASTLLFWKNSVMSISFSISWDSVSIKFSSTLKLWTFRASKYPIRLFSLTLKYFSVVTNAILFDPALIKWPTASQAISASFNTTLSHSISEVTRSKRTIGIPWSNNSFKWVYSFFNWVSALKERIKPSILPFANISMLMTSFSLDSSEIQTITLYPFSFAYFSIPLKTVVKKWWTISGIITPMFFVLLFLRLRAILLGR